MYRDSPFNYKKCLQVFNKTKTLPLCFSERKKSGGEGNMEMFALSGTDSDSDLELPKFEKQKKKKKSKVGATIFGYRFINGR